MYFILPHAYRQRISAIIHKINSVHKSGISKKTANNKIFITIKLIKNCCVFIVLRFLINHDEKKRTYHNLKNSDGWRLHKIGISIHHLAPLSVTPSHGINTANCKIIIIIQRMMMFLFFWKNLNGSKYIHVPIIIPITMFLICLKK